VPAIYLYQLVDDRRDEEDWSKSLGLYDVDWRPKPAAHAIHHLTRTLSSSSSSRITTPSFQYTVSGRSAGVQSLSLRKTDGTIDLLIWREARLWDDQARRLTPAERRRLSVSARAGHASLVDTFTGERRELRSDTGNFELVLDDRPVIVEFPSQSTKPRTLEK
jgi:hypothetical protein